MTQRFTGLDFGYVLSLETRIYGSKNYNRARVNPEMFRKIHISATS